MVQNLGPRNVSFCFGCIDFNTLLPASSTGLYPEEAELSVLSHTLLTLKAQRLMWPGFKTYCYALIKKNVSLFDDSGGGV
jgi:hypothetical protein